MSSGNSRTAVTKETLEEERWGELENRSGVHLLGEHVAAKGDAPLQSDGREVRTMSSLGLRPGLHGRNQSSDGRANETQQAEISANCLDPIAVFGPLRAQMQELHDAVEILAGRSPLYAGD